MNGNDVLKTPKPQKENSRALIEVLIVEYVNGKAVCEMRPKIKFVLNEGGI